MSSVYKINEKANYRGCGQAWAAIVDNEVVDVRYFADNGVDKARHGLGVLATNAELLSFHDYQDRCIAELKEISDFIEIGMCSCFEFIAD